MPRKKKIETTTEHIANKLLENAIENTQKVVVAKSITTMEAKTSFDVLNSSGGYVRTYSVEMHGENAEKLAHQYAGKIGGSIR